MHRSRALAGLVSVGTHVLRSQEEDSLKATVASRSSVHKHPLMMMVFMLKSGE